MRRPLIMLLTLGKTRIALLSTLSTAAGFFLSSGEFPLRGLFTFLGVFLLASGSAALNQYQDREIDALMERTRTRPIPAGELAAHTALVVALLWLFSGLLILYFGSLLAAAVLGLFAVFWYNAVYFWLKRRTPFAAFPGALVGAIPPVIGWVAGGGHIFDPGILAVAFFFFIWQVPHFWLLLLKNGGDYRRIGLPSLAFVFSRKQLSRITFVWITATAVACILIPLFGMINSPILSAGFFAAGMWVVWKSRGILVQGGEDFVFATLFRKINVYALLVISLLSLNAFLG